MKKILLMILAGAIAVASGGGGNSEAATLTVNYGWEDGTSTILGSFGNLSNAANVATGDEYSNSAVITSGVTPNSGTRMLELEESPHSGTPQAYLAYIENLAAGDSITASFFGWDSTASASPSLRIWGHWANNGDVNSYVSSAGGNSTFGDGSGWFEVDQTWVAAAGNDALVVEARLYSSPSTADPAFSTFFVDDLSIEVTSASGLATITTPGGVTAVPEPGALAGIFSLGLFGAAVGRRRRR